MNIAEPIELDAVLDNLRPDWRETVPEDGERPAWLGDVVDELGADIMSNINAAAAVTPISMLACVLLATPKQKMGAQELKRQLELYLALMQNFRYSESVTLPDWSPEMIIRHGEDLAVIGRSSHPMGDIIHMTEHTAVLMTYFRNNILH